jgi:hypothetical protein
MNRRRSAASGWTRCLLAVSGLLFLGCAPRAPDEEALATLISTTLVDDKVAKMGRVLIVDRSSLNDLPSQVQTVFRNHIEATMPGWLLEDVVGKGDALPGTWEVVEGLGRVNKTHLFLTFTLERSGSRRILTYMRSWCAVCGWGEKLELSWDGEKWNQRRLMELRM